MLSENEYTPDVSANAAMNTVTFDESTAIGSAIYTAVATDMDASDFGVIRSEYYNYVTLNCPLYTSDLVHAFAFSHCLANYSPVPLFYLPCHYMS